MLRDIIMHKYSFWLSFMFALPASVLAAALPDARAIDEKVSGALRATSANGLALAVIDEGRVAEVRTYGMRNERGDKLERDTIMYGASLTKAVFAYTVMQLAQEAKIDLDASIARYLDKPLPSYAHEEKYARWSDLAGDDRWREITPRILLTHSAGFANFGFLEPDGKLRIHFSPGSRYAYSGEGLILLQFVIERGLGLDVGQEVQRRVFDRFGMSRSSLIWRGDFAANLADGWTLEGKVEPHDQRSKVRAAGSMDTTIEDFARFAAAYVRAEGLQPHRLADLVRPQLPIRTRTQFPTLQPEAETSSQEPGLAAGLGVVVFEGQQGPGFFKGGHNESTANTWVCLHRRRRCVVILSNDVRAESAIPTLVEFILGDTGVPWRWEYGDLNFWSDSKQ